MFALSPSNYITYAVHIINRDGFHLIQLRASPSDGGLARSLVLPLQVYKSDLCSCTHASQAEAILSQHPPCSRTME